MHRYSMVDCEPPPTHAPFLPQAGAPFTPGREATRALVEKVGQIVDVMHGGCVRGQPWCSLDLRRWLSMSAPDPRIADYGRRLLARLGDRALTVAHDMTAHLIAIGDSERADEWHRISVAIECARREPATSQAAEEPDRPNPADLWLRTLKELEEIGKRRRGGAAEAGAETPDEARDNWPISEPGENSH